MKSETNKESEMPTEEKGFVYFIGEAIENKWGQITTEYVKVGWTTGKPEIRLKALQTSNPRPLFLLGTIKTNQQAEKMIHNQLSDARVRGEWFDFNKIKSRLVMWLPIYNYYDFDSDCLCNDSPFSDVFDLKNKQKNGAKRKTLFQLDVEDKNIFYWFPFHYENGDVRNLLKPTTANKDHFDIIGNIIQEGDEYYLIDLGGVDYAAKTKISLSSLSIFKKFLKEFNLYELIKNISLRQKEKFYSMQQKETEKIKGCENKFLI